MINENEITQEENELEEEDILKKTKVNDLIINENEDSFNFGNLEVAMSNI